MASSAVLSGMSSDSEDSSDDDDDDDDEENDDSNSNSTGRATGTARFTQEHNSKRDSKERKKSNTIMRFNFDLNAPKKTMIERMREKERKDKKGKKKRRNIGVRFNDGEEEGEGEGTFFTNSSSTSTTSTTTSSQKGREKFDDNFSLYPVQTPVRREGVKYLGYGSPGISGDVDDASGANGSRTSSPSTSYCNHISSTNYNYKTNTNSNSNFPSGSGSGSGSGCIGSFEMDRGGREAERDRNRDIGTISTHGRGILESVSGAILTLFSQKCSPSFLDSPVFNSPTTVISSTASNSNIVNGLQ